MSHTEKLLSYSRKIRGISTLLVIVHPESQPLGSVPIVSSQKLAVRRRASDVPCARLPMPLADPQCANTTLGILTLEMLRRLIRLIRFATHGEVGHSTHTTHLIPCVHSNVNSNIPKGLTLYRIFSLLFGTAIVVS